VSVCQKTRARAIHLAAGDERDRFVDARATLDVAGRDRLASSDTHAGAADGRVSKDFFSLFSCVFHHAVKKMV